MYNHMIEILTALNEGRTIQFQGLSGAWFDIEIKDYIPNFKTDKYRIKSEEIKYRVALFKNGNFYPMLITNDEVAEAVERDDSTFVKWLTDWVECDLEQL